MKRSAPAKRQHEPAKPQGDHQPDHGQPEQLPVQPAPHARRGQPSTNPAARKLPIHPARLLFALIAVFVVALPLIILVRSATFSPSQNGTQTYADAFFTYERTQYETSVHAIAPVPGKITIGFVTDPWNLKFGDMPFNGSEGKRGLRIYNPYADPAKIRLSVSGNISSMVRFSRSDFVIPGSGNETVNVKVRTGPAIGNFTGMISVTAIRPRNAIGGLLLGMV